MSLTAAEQVELMALIADAFDVRGTPAHGDACRAVGKWADELAWRRAQRAVRRREARVNQLVAAVQEGGRAA